MAEMAILGVSFFHQTVIFDPWLRPTDLLLSSIFNIDTSTTTSLLPRLNYFEALGKKSQITPLEANQIIYHAYISGHQL